MRLEERVAKLEAIVARLRQTVADLQAALRKKDWAGSARGGGICLQLGQARPLGGHQGHHSASIAPSPGNPIQQRTTWCCSATQATAPRLTNPPLPALNAPNLDPRNA